MSEKTIGNVSTKRRRKKKVSDVVAAAMPQENPETSGIITVVGNTVEPTPEYELTVPFVDRVRAFNIMYKLPVNGVPTNQGVDRMRKFKDILLEEIKEVDDIIHRLEVAQKFREQGLDTQADAAELIAFTDQLDWFTDIQVYCVSEMWKWGLDPTLGHTIVMDSNASKLGKDGNPIYDERGKVMKGEGYWKPELLMMKELRTLIADAKK